MTNLTNDVPVTSLDSIWLYPEQGDPDAGEWFWTTDLSGHDPDDVRGAVQFTRLTSQPAQSDTSPQAPADVVEAAYQRFLGRIETGFAGCDPRWIFQAGFNAALASRPTPAEAPSEPPADRSKAMDELIAMDTDLLDLPAEDAVERGDDEDATDTMLAKAGINVGEHFNKIEVYGHSLEEAQNLRNRVIAFLSAQQGQGEICAENAQKSAAQADRERVLRDLLADAYSSGATDTHNSWVRGDNGSEPDFGEAASDYASSVDLDPLANTTDQSAQSDAVGEHDSMCAALAGRSCNCAIRNEAADTGGEAS